MPLLSAGSVVANTSPHVPLAGAIQRVCTRLLIGLSKFAEHGSSVSVYTGDSYGDHSYVDTSMARACSMQCHCRHLRSDSFAFEVRKTASGIGVKPCNLKLRSYLRSILAPVPCSQTPSYDVSYDVFSGFDLLKHIDHLESGLRKLRAEMQDSFPSHPDTLILKRSSVELARLEAEVSLLVEGLLADDQVFESFGYENLYEKGYLTYYRWKSFQSSKTSRSLDQLDWATNSIDQLEDEDFNEIGSDVPAELFQESRSMPCLPSLGVTCPQYEIKGPVDDKYLPLIAAIYMGKSDVIAELLARGTNSMILSHIKQEDRWLVAKSLLDHGVNATSLFESTHGFEHVEPRLLYVLMEGGADIYSSWSTSTQGFLTHSLHVSGHEIQEAKSMRAHNFQLLSAIQRGDLGCVEEHISHGADPTFGIDSALVGGQWEILRWLLQKGADPRVLEFGMPTVHLQEDVMKDGCLLTVAEEGLTTVVKSLLQLRGFNKMVAEGLRKPSLTRLIQYDRTTILRMLLCKGVFSRDYLSRSSNWCLPLAAETSMPLFSLLLDFGACASTALIAAVTDRNLKSVILLLKRMKEIPMPNNINALRVHGHMTLLMKAVDSGSVEIAQHLIDNGADPYIDTWYGDSFAIAEVKGFKGLSQMLRRVPTSPGPATSSKDWGDFRLEKEVTWLMSELLFQAFHEAPKAKGSQVCNPVKGFKRPNVPTVRKDFLNSIKIRCLHREFRKQHTHIVKCARASTNLGWSRSHEGPHCPAWGDVFDYNFSKAWSRGIAVMRGLCRGEVPSTLYDTIMFLAIGKAICLSKIGSSLSDHHAKFLADLGRWQVLFRLDKWSLSAFRNAVSDIWHVSTEELDRNCPLDSTSLIQFQELAMSLIKIVEQSFDRQGELGKGLLASQERWSWNRVPEMSEAKSPEPFDMQFPDNIVERGKFTESDTPASTVSGETDVSQSPESAVPLRDAMHNDSQTCNTIVVLLMAGFVFSVFLVFLKGTSLESSLMYFMARLIPCALRAATSPTTADSVQINYGGSLFFCPSSRDTSGRSPPSLCDHQK